MEATLAAAIERALGARVRDVRSVAGGDIDRAFGLELEGGPRVFVKVARDGSLARVEAEARGLGWLADASPDLVPAPLAVLPAPAALVLPWIERGASTPASDERLGRSIAALHRFGAPAFGALPDGFLATIPVQNAEAPDWPSFYGERRLSPLARRAEARGAIDAGLQRRIERLVPRLGERCGPPEPPARLHGDLWGGNAMVDGRGAPHVFDPSAFGGHREIDLAMMRLFGGFSARVFSAYAEAFPLTPGHEERVELCQLLPLLAHCVLFGGGWARSVESALDAIGA